ncbi:MAG: TIGR00282 family metallophosphoesterase [Armatimonadetes bacterium]|nr:TIGR00282 family metallophosphoesterase [Armatimonadota bacterium]
MKILFVGDIVGRPGRRALAMALPRLVDKYDCEFVIANGENAAAGFGLSRKVADEIFAAGVDVMTTGNHVWADKEIFQLLGETDRILRPANFPLSNPGFGSGIYATKSGHTVGVINLIGRIFMDPVESPFLRGDEELAKVSGADAIIVDFHAEATSEKRALGYYFAGRVSAVIGTHTHVMTCDEEILPGGTAYISDCGMAGPMGTVIGIEKEIALRRFLTGLPERFEVPKAGPALLSAVVVEVSLDNKAALDIQRISLKLTERNPDLVEL